MTANTTIDARRVPPGSLIIDANVREDTKIDRTFVSSVKQHGVLVPLLVYVDGDTLRVKDGQRRALAAVDAGLDTVPVIVVDQDSDAERIIDQLVVNDHRADLSEAEHNAAFKQLSLFGISADAISRKTNIPKKRVQLSLDVAASDVAAAALATYQLTLEQAAIVLEFEDAPEDVESLTEAVKTGRFDHTVARLRDRREEQQVLATARTAYEPAGYTIIDEQPEYADPRRIERLYASKEHQKSYRGITAEEHADCPGRAVFFTIGWQWNDTTDKRVKVAEARHLCLDPEGNGHLLRVDASSSKVDGGLTEAEKAARKLTRENNKAWAIATPVRVAFVTALLQRKEPPAGWEAFVATFLAHHLDNYTLDKSAAGNLLGGKANGESLAKWWKENPTRPGHVAVALAIAGLEGHREFGKNGWRFYRQEFLIGYLEQLSVWGYAFSDIEERVVNGTATKVQA